MMIVQQIIEGRYINSKALQSLLAQKFRYGEYSMTVKTPQ